MAVLGLTQPWVTQVTGPPRPVSIASANRTSSWSVVAAIKAGHFVDYDILLPLETLLPRGREPQAQLQAKQFG